MPARPDLPEDGLGFFEDPKAQRLWNPPQFQLSGLW